MDPEATPLSQDLPSGQYLMEWEREGESNLLDGPVYFDYSIQKGNMGDKRIFKLQFVNTSMSAGPGFEFLIPLGDASQVLGVKTYEVGNEKSSFLSGVDAVFGYADLREESSLYFTESGEISILVASEGEISGKIEILMNDGRGKTFNLKGSFRARPMPEDLKI